ncbi:MAG: hypothetical protein KDD67_04340 [Ignavibacteriae bacterium]|nr:hypothetical protein [Ignavibacteriota bacterium]MCB9217038.1 hypothetical protein [Ignavibacteria bacterium]
MISLQIGYTIPVRTFIIFGFLLLSATSAEAQADLLPLDHPATLQLERFHRAGAIPTFPAEHLPISRRSALKFLEEAAAAEELSELAREQAKWMMVELRADIGEEKRVVVIPLSSDQEEFFDAPFTSRPFTGIAWYDTASRSTIFLDPVLDGEVRYDEVRNTTAAIFQGGVRIRGTALNHIGFSGRATNGTIVGNDTVVRVDPRYGRSFKFGVIQAQRDIDFGSAHLRAEFDGLFAEIGREQVRLGLGGKRTLLFGADLPSNTDYFRLGGQIGKVSFTHVHASLLDDTTGRAVGIGAEIPSKYLATHLLSVGPFAGLRFSVGEAVIYSGRQLEIGYVNPLNFIKSQEHYLRDRDNSMMYAALSASLPEHIFLEGEFLLDDLIFSNIGKGFWGNKTAWRLSADIVGLFDPMLDFGLSYTRLEPYVYSHFKTLNSYVHDGSGMAASGLDPNSSLFESKVTLWPISNLRAEITLGIGRHGANVVENGQVVRNVGGDIRRTYDSTSNEKVEFLDGTLEKSTSIDVRLDYEVLRNIYLRSHLFSRSIDRAGSGVEKQVQLWLGVSVGAR